MLDYNEHMSSVEELEERYGTNVATGLSNDKAEELLKQNGLNRVKYEYIVMSLFVEKIMDVFFLFSFEVIFCFEKV